MENSIEEKVIEKAYKKLRLDALVIQQGRLTDNSSTKVGAWVRVRIRVRVRVWVRFQVQVVAGPPRRVRALALVIQQGWLTDSSSIKVLSQSC